MKQIMFSRVFPAYHPRKGQETNFVFSILNSLGIPHGYEYKKLLLELNPDQAELVERFYLSTKDIFSKSGFVPKKHTIRSGNNWKVGDKFQPKVWAGKPYRSKTLNIAPPITIEKIWNFELTEEGYFIDRKLLNINNLSFISRYDGLSAEDFKDWFSTNQSFKGQIICWDKELEYGPELIPLWAK